MKPKAFIAVRGALIEKYIKFACVRNNVDVVMYDKGTNLIDEIKKVKPNIAFVQATVLEESEDNIVALIKSNEELRACFLVVPAGRDEGADFAYSSGADAFLPVPFVEEQIDSIFRRALNLAKKILVVSASANEDSKFCQALTAKGYNLIVAENSDMGLKIADKSFPELILCDWELTDGNAPEFCRNIKSASRISRVPVVVMCDRNDEAMEEDCTEAGAVGIIIPPYESEESLAEIMQIAAPIRTGKKQKIMVVDSDSSARSEIMNVARQMEYDAAGAESAENALKIIESEEPDIIIAGYDLPAMDSYDFCSKVKADSETKSIPVIMLADSEENLDVKKMALSGFTGCLRTPFKIEDFRSVVKGSLEQVRRVKEHEIISRYVSGDIVQNAYQILSGTNDFEPQEKFVSILVCDIVGFTPRCERYNPRQIVEILNSFYDSMITVLLVNNATIEKLVGDAILARFDTGDKEKDAFNAVKAAHEMIEVSRVLKLGIVEDLQIRVGVNSGPVFMGNFGSEKFVVEYTMIGDNINVAQSLEGSAPQNGCMISKSTHNLVKQNVEVGSGKSISIKGRSNLVRAYELKDVVDK